jgi:hypothetical protein
VASGAARTARAERRADIKRYGGTEKNEKTTTKHPTGSGTCILTIFPQMAFSICCAGLKEAGQLVNTLMQWAVSLQ